MFLCILFGMGAGGGVDGEVFAVFEGIFADTYQAFREGNMFQVVAARERFYYSFSFPPVKSHLSVIPA